MAIKPRMSQSAQVLYEFGPFRLDPSQDQLLEGTRKVPLTPKAYQTLLVLVENRGRTLGKDELLQRVWPDAFVEEATLAQNIFTLRKHLRDDRETALYIETVPKRGYRFVAKVRQVQSRTTPLQLRPRFTRSTLVYVVVVLCVFAAAMAGWYSTQWKATREHVSSVTQPKPITLAVLPFRGLSDRAGEESWGIGMTDAVMHPSHIVAKPCCAADCVGIEILEEPGRSGPGRAGIGCGVCIGRNLSARRRQNPYLCSTDRKKQPSNALGRTL